TSVAVHQYIYQHVGPWTQHADPSRGLTLALPVDCLGDFGPRWLSVQYTQDIRGCPPAHTGRPWLSVAVRQASAHTGRLWLSVTLVLGLSTLAHPVDCLGDFGPRGLSVQYKQDICGCPPDTPEVRGCQWLSLSTHMTSVAVCVCPCVSVSTHRTSVALHQYTYQHAERPWVIVSTHRTSVCVRQHTQDDVRWCPPAHTGRPWLSVCVRVCPSAHI
ncbi:unnamed protein product, partial [Brassica rapa]